MPAILFGGGSSTNHGCVEKTSIKLKLSVVGEKKVIDAHEMKRSHVHTW